MDIKESKCSKIVSLVSMNKKQVFLMSIVSFIVLLIVIVGCFFIGKDKKNIEKNQKAIVPTDVKNENEEEIGNIQNKLDPIEKDDTATSTGMKGIVTDSGDYKDNETWESYNHDILGISFEYPKSWGEPFTEPVDGLTDLKEIFDKYAGGSSLYESNIKIGFTNSDTAVNLINDNSISPYDFDIYLSRPGNLKNISNTCDLDSVSSGATVLEKVCQNSVFSVYGKKGTNNLYFNLLYFSRDYSLAQLQNGFYDKALIINGIAWLSNAYGTSTQDLDFDNFLGAIEVEKDEYAKKLSIFSKFANSIKSYKPKEYPIIFNETKEGENGDIAIVKKYYNNILRGQLSEAYEMYKVKKVNLETFSGWYKNTIYAHAHDFVDVGGGKYQFLVDFQDHNSKPQKYRVTMVVDHGKIETVASEELTSEKVKSFNMEVFTKNSRGFNSVVLSVNNNEIVVDSARDDFMKYISETLRFNRLSFSPQGNYLLYSANGWEWGFGRVYDIKNKSIIAKNDLPTPSLFGVSKNEKYLYACAANDFGGVYYANVYSLPSFSLLLDAYDKELPHEKYLLNAKCEINDDEVLMISLKCSGLGSEEKCNNERKIKFDLKSGKIIK